jgi:DNA (cytosine-5)-methyltransferase 1
MKPLAVAVDVFAGGFSLGVETHFTVAAHLERCTIGAKTWRHNRPAVPIHLDRTSNWLDALTALRPRAPMFVYGNPPCRAFSLASAHARERGSAAQDAWWAREVVRVAAALEAPVVAIESTRGALRAAPVVHHVIWEEFKDRYPGQMWILVNAFNHGLPQWRPRVFWVLAPEVFGWRAPALQVPSLRDCLDRLDGCTNVDPDMSRYIDMRRRVVNDVSIGDAILDLVPYLKPGQRMWATRTDAETRARRDWVAFCRDRHPVLVDYLETRAIVMHTPRRLAWDTPSPVIYGAESKYVHPEQHRFLSVRELSRICGFPDDWTWAESIPPSQMSTLGRGVCPPVARWLAGEIAAYLRGERAERGPGSVLVPIAAMSPTETQTWLDVEH